MEHLAALSARDRATAERVIQNMRSLQEEYRTRLLAALKQR
jgi:hypothetical protein